MLRDRRGRTRGLLARRPFIVQAERTKYLPRSTLRPPTASSARSNGKTSPPSSSSPAGLARRSCGGRARSLAPAYRRALQLPGKALVPHPISQKLRWPRANFRLASKGLPHPCHFEHFDRRPRELGRPPRGEGAAHPRCIAASGARHRAESDGSLSAPAALHFSSLWRARPCIFIQCRTKSCSFEQYRKYRSMSF
jgi:hypothetical protein